MPIRETGEFSLEAQMENIDSRFVSFEQYKNIGGEMTQDEYTNAQRQEEDEQLGLEKLADIGRGLPTTEMVLVFSKIAAAFPKKHPMWVLVETYCCMGKN